VKVTPKIAMFTLTALALAGGGASTAFASTQTVPKAPAAVNWSQPTTNPGSDGEQQNDQTTSNGQSQNKQHKQNKADPSDTAVKDKKSVRKGESGSKDAADGPGGHADPAGNVNHEATGQE
jgi:hypothetical protein